jgi:hypothetical protein
MLKQARLMSSTTAAGRLLSFFAFDSFAFICILYVLVMRVDQALWPAL